MTAQDPNPTGAQPPAPDTASEKQPDIHGAVRTYYGTIAQRATDALPMAQSSCCSSDSSSSCCSDRTAVYDPDLLVDLPVDVTGLSLGCGDPVSIASLNAEETVLDLGSGGGIDCFMAARQVGPRGTVIGVDMTPEMIARANENKARMGVTNVEFRQGQIEALPVDDNSVDVILSNCVINLAPDKRPVFAEAFRVLKPGGRLSVSDIVTTNMPPVQESLDLQSWSACVAGAIDVADYLDLLRDAGFEDVAAVDKAETAKVTDPETGEARVYSARITARKPLSA